jgi:ferredoxin
MADLTAAFVAAGTAAADVHEELFGAALAINPGVVSAGWPARAVTIGAGTGPVVSFARSGPTVDWDPAFESLLALAEAAGVPTRWSCRTGVCHTCETALVSGSVSYSPDPLDAPADGNALICCSQPQSDVVLDL